MIVKLRKRGVGTLLCEAGVLALLGEQDFHQQFATALTSAVTGLAEGADGAAKANPQSDGRCQPGEGFSCSALKPR